MIELDLDEDAEGEGESDHDQQPGDDEEEPAAGPDTRVSARLAVISGRVCDNIVSTWSVTSEMFTKSRQCRILLGAGIMWTVFHIHYFWKHPTATFEKKI